jgi:hypothetical protein
MSDKFSRALICAEVILMGTGAAYQHLQHVLGLCLMYGGLFALILTLLWEDRGLPLLPKWRFRWGKIPLWKAAKIARSKLLNYEVQRHAEAYVKSTTGHDQYDWYATYLAEDFPLYGRKIPYPELVSVPKPIIVYDGGRRLGNLGGQTLYEEPLIDRSSLKQFIKVKRNEPR